MLLERGAQSRLQESDQKWIALHQACAEVHGAVVSDLLECVGGGEATADMRDLVAAENGEEEGLQEGSFGLRRDYYC